MDNVDLRIDSESLYFRLPIPNGVEISRDRDMVSIKKEGIQLHFGHALLQGLLSNP